MDTQMTQKHNRGLLAFCGFVFVFMIISFFSTSLQGGEKHYEIRPEITVPEYKTDMSRLIDSYENLMNNYMKLTAQNFPGIQGNTAEIIKKIDLLDQKVTVLSAQIETIQKKLGIEIPQAATTLKNETDDTKPENISD